MNLSALRHNFTTIRNQVTNAKILAIIKANAYGHGLTRIAHALPQVDGFGVATLDEGLQLRQSGIKQFILILQGFVNPEELATAIQDNLAIVVHHPHQVESLLASATVWPKIWYKINTGMGRLGFSMENWQGGYHRLSGDSRLTEPMVLMSHFANADQPNNPHTQTQLRLFADIQAQTNARASLANSAGILAWPNSHYHWVRPGLILFGISPFLTDGSIDDSEVFSGTTDNFQPVMTLTSRIVAINGVKPGDTVGYGCHWVAKKRGDIGIVSIGYGDGYPRNISTDALVLIQGQRYPIVGVVSMDMICVDLGIQHSISIGESVTLWGKDLPITILAQAANSIPYELLCKIGRRVQIME